VDGICRAKNIKVAEDDPGVQQAIKRALVRERRKLDAPAQSVVLNKQAVPAGASQTGDSTMNAGAPVRQSATDSGAVAAGTPDAQVTDVLFIAVIAGFCGAAFIGLLIAIICYCRMRKSAKETSDTEYASYGGGTNGPGNYPSKPPSVDRKLAQSAQMFHYQHQKQQMLEMEKAQEVAAKSDEEVTSDDEFADDHTVYECPGLANTGEMEVRNPLYTESPLPPRLTPPPTPETPATNHPDPPGTTHLVNGHGND